MVITLRNARPDTCGGKAAVLAALLREGLPVPDGFVIPFSVRRAAGCAAGPSVSQAVREDLARHLDDLGDPPVAVRSSAADEDTPGASAAGRYESLLGVRGAQEVAEAVQVCWESASSHRATGHRDRPGSGPTGGEADMAVLVQRLVDADLAGVLFTPEQPGHGTRIEATWGLGVGIVGGTLTPDTYEVGPDGAIRRTIAPKRSRIDRTRGGTGLTVRTVPPRQQTRPALDDASVTVLAGLGHRIAARLGRPQDIEWAIAGGQAWILQARPITAPLPALPSSGPAESGSWLAGSPGAHGIATGVARVLKGPFEIPRVRPGDIVVCRYTDPAWTPVFRVAAAVVTETGGVLSHAAIVAREHGIPAVLGVPSATSRIRDGARIIVNGSAGTISQATRDNPDT